jgi:hypothetical protein
VILAYCDTTWSPPVIPRVVTSTWVFPFLDWRCQKFFIPNTLVFQKKVLAEGGGRSDHAKITGGSLCVTMWSPPVVRHCCHDSSVATSDSASCHIHVGISFFGLEMSKIFHTQYPSFSKKSFGRGGWSVRVVDKHWWRTRYIPPRGSLVATTSCHSSGGSLVGR